MTLLFATHNRHTHTLRQEQGSALECPQLHCNGLIPHVKSAGTTHKLKRRLRVFSCEIQTRTASENLFIKCPHHCKAFYKMWHIHTIQLAIRNKQNKWSVTILFVICHPWTVFFEFLRFWRVKKMPHATNAQPLYFKYCRQVMFALCWHFKKRSN